MPIASFQYNFEADELCHMAEYEDFSTNSVLTVQYGQQAVFMRNGVPVDESFREGRHILDSAVIDSVANCEKQTLIGGRSYHAKVYYVNTAKNISISWGTPKGFFVEDPITGQQFHAGATGSYSLCVDDPKIFLLKTVGQMSAESGYVSYTKWDVEDFIDTKLAEIIQSLISRIVRGQRYEILDYATHLGEISSEIRKALDENGIFAEHGFKLRNFSLDNIGLSDEDYAALMSERNERIKAKKEADIAFTMGDVENRLKDSQLSTIDRHQGSYALESQREVLTAAAQNEASGQGMNMGLGLVYAQQFGQAIGGMMNGVNQPGIQPQSAPAQSAPAQSGVTCPKCQKTLPAGAAFCSFCGEKIPQANKCANCGADLPIGAAFCSKCGTRVESKPVSSFCSSCGQAVEPGTAFCPSCGKEIK